MVDDVDVESTDEYVLTANRFRKVWTSLGEKGEVQHHAKRWYRGDVVSQDDLDPEDFERLIRLEAIRLRSDIEAEKQAAEAQAEAEQVEAEDAVEPDLGDDVNPEADPDNPDANPEDDVNPDVEPEPEPNPEDPDKGESEDPEAEVKGGDEDTDSTSPVAEPVDYSTWDYADLQQEAKRLTDDGSGGKQALIDRLTAYQQVHSASE